MKQSYTQFDNNNMLMSLTIKVDRDMQQIDGNRLNKEKAQNNISDMIPAISNLQQHYWLGNEHRTTILLIDDRKDMPHKLSKILYDSFFLTTNDIRIATRLLKDTMPNLIIINMMTASINGLDFVRSVKQNKHTMQIPLIILSANTSTDEQIKGLKYGANMYLPIQCELNYLCTVINSLLEQIQMLKEFYTTSASSYSYSSGHLISAEDREFIDKITELIDKNMEDSDFNTDKFAELMGLSRRSLYRKFDSAKLPPVNLFIRECRIQKAAQLLRTTLMTISEIMYKTGFETRSLFYSEFHKHFHTTPKVYRRQHLTKDETL